MRQFPHKRNCQLLRFMDVWVLQLEFDWVHAKITLSKAKNSRMSLMKDYFLNLALVFEEKHSYALADLTKKGYLRISAHGAHRIPDFFDKVCPNLHMRNFVKDDSKVKVWIIFHAAEAERIRRLITDCKGCVDISNNV
jgi:hypothetical protein